MPTPPQPATAGKLPETPVKPLDALATSPAPAPDPAPDVDAATIEKPLGAGFVVAPGRTVDGKLHPDTVELSDADAKRFVELGFVLDKDGVRRVSEGGPAVNVEDGVQVKPA
jgi:hypothetical protein